MQTVHNVNNPCSRPRTSIQDAEEIRESKIMRKKTQIKVKRETEGQVENEQT